MKSETPAGGSGHVGQKMSACGPAGTSRPTSGRCVVGSLGAKTLSSRKPAGGGGMDSEGWKARLAEGLAVTAAGVALAERTAAVEAQADKERCVLDPRPQTARYAAVSAEYGLG